MLDFISLLEADEVTKFQLVIRSFFALIIKLLYKFFSWTIDMMYSLATFDFGLDDYVQNITDKIYNLLIIYMLFRITLSLLTYLVNPDSFFDKANGAVSILKKVLIAVILLVSINPIFNVLVDLQDDIINTDIITTVFGSTTEGEIKKIDDVYVYGVKMSDQCDSDRHVYTFSQGDHMALLLLRPFIQPYTELDFDLDDDKYQAQQEKINSDDPKTGMYCGIVYDTNKEFTYVMGADNRKGLKAAIDGPNSAEDYMAYKLYGAKNKVGEDTFLFEFNYFFATIAGFFAALITISFCFDVVIRSLTILFLKIIAPIPIIGSINPKKNDSLGIWFKKLGSVWASLFMRIAILNLAITLIGTACNKLDENQGEVTFIMQVFLILGVLMFAKRLPKLIEEVLPGLKLDAGLQLNPLKRITGEALGGAALLGGTSALAGAITGAGAQTASNLIAFGRNKSNLKKQIALAQKKGDTDKANKLQRRLDRMSGIRGAGRILETTAGGIAGGARRGVVSGAKTGKSGSLNVFKNIKGDLKDGNTVRNNRDNIRYFNSEVKQGLQADYDAAKSTLETAKNNRITELQRLKNQYETEVNNLKAQKNSMSAGAYNSRMDMERKKYAQGRAKAEQDYKLASEAYKNRKAQLDAQYKEDNYSFTDRNITETLDNFAGVKNITGGFGRYSNEVEELTKKIDNLNQSELALRQSLMSKLGTKPGDKLAFDQLEELRDLLAKGIDIGVAQQNIATKYNINVSDVSTTYTNHKADLEAITRMDQQAIEYKAQRKNYQEMMDARQKLKDSK